MTDAAANDPARECGNCRYWRVRQGATGACYFHPPRIFIVAMSPQEDVPGKILAQQPSVRVVQQVPMSMRPTTENADPGCGTHRFEDEPADTDAVAMILDSLTSAIVEIAGVAKMAAKAQGVPSGRVTTPGESH